VSETSNLNERAAAQAAVELAHLQGQVETVRAVLVRLLQDVVEAEIRLGSQEAAQLLEANERLVVTAMRHQTEAETAARALNAVSRTAELDVLTHLPNRVLLLDRFAQAIANAQRHGTRLALLFMDIDNFKQINDSFGHAVGDEVLKRTAHCLAAAVRDADTVSRHGGDEFVVLLAEVSDASGAALVADKIVAALGVPFRIGAHALALTASIGIAIYPDDGEDADTLLDRADTAMYRAKRHALGSVVFHGDQPRQATREAAPRHGMLRRPAAEDDERHAQMREANEQLVLAALGAQELQDAAALAQRRQLEFLAVAAHELHNPLAPIRVATALLGRARADEPLLPMVRAIIDRQVAHMSRLVGEPLDLAQLQVGRLAPKFSVVDMTDIIHAVVHACRPVMDTRGQQFEVQVPAGPLEVCGDPVRLVHILSNLLDNASKYTHRGGKIGLSAEVAEGALAITVTDTGIGITTEALPDIFDPFVQDTHAIGFNGIGLGIGLTVVRELVKAHGGDVVAHSGGRGLGSQFVVTLRLIERPASR
jgi:diguanylate cyclase